jgi:hypothetical protein
MMHADYRDRFPRYSSNMTGLLDLPPELINVIVGYLAPPPDIPRTHPFGMPDPCPCLPKADWNRELVLYDSRPEHLETAYETDAMRFGLAHPYIGACILSGGWRGTVDALFLADKQDIGVIPYVPEGYRKMIRYVISACRIDYSPRTTNLHV